ncbi:MAG: hypothetical protein ABIR18_10830, partial [Chitinophagaceae bacterium]
MKITNSFASIVLLLILLVFIESPGYAQMSNKESQPLYLDTKQPTEKRVRDLISRLTLEEKAT